MSSSKPKIYNLTLSALLLSREVTDIATDKSNEVRILNTHYDIAFESTLQDLDLDQLSTPITLELIEKLTTGPWDFVYKYPTDCAFFRRIESGVITDNNSTHIPKRTGIFKGQAAIFTDEDKAIGECIPKTVPLNALNAMAVLALAYKLAFLSAPLIVGKGSKKLRESLQRDYLIAKGESQEMDSRENFMYEPEHLRSEWVRARLS